MGAEDKDKDPKGAGTGAADPTKNADDSGKQSDGGAATPFAVFPDEKSFMSRVSREAKKQLEVQAKELGFDSVEAMSAAYKAAKEHADAQKTELQRAEDARKAAEAKGQQAIERANARLINAEVAVRATALGIVDHEAAAVLMDRSGVKVTEDGKVEGIDDALKELVKAKPYLVGDKKQKDPKKTGDDQGSGAEKKSGLSFNDLIRKATGRLD